ncbi:MAG: thioredoxin-dependent thiol peroxidase [Deltaproteobacteria bacterium]|nr:thioredoxin-dependent thiol peroxidase [Deltaproteobacteria bacterium]
MPTQNELEEGMKAPAFTAESSDGGEVSLGDFKGKNVVLYFYPKDNTPGCTREACGFRDANAELKKLGTVVLGVSKDSLKAHDKFIGKYDLNFPLLSDPEKTMHKAYGAWGKKKMYGKLLDGVIRSTFLIDGEGTVRKIWRNVKVNGHVEKVLEAVKSLN